MKRYIYIVLMMVGMVWTACEKPQEEPTNKSAFSLSICLPADETNTMRPAGGSRRVMGDPGTTEQFALPNYVYIIVMKKAEGDPDWSLWDASVVRPAAEDWVKQRYVGLLKNTGDSIYRYDVEINKMLSSTRFNGRVYIIASAEELSFTPTLNAANLNSLEAIENLTFDASDADVQRNLQHIYSTPCNYLIDGEYYGFFDRRTIVPHIDLMLYHVAMKVDITWNVADTARIKRAGVNPIRLTYMDACNLYNRDAYCFQPMKNSSGESPVTPEEAGTGDTIHIVTPTDEGLWWEGRSYFYTIPYTCTSHAGCFPLQMKMATNDSTKYYRPTIYMNVESDTTFVPWMRATFNLSRPLTEGTENKTPS